MTEEHMDWVENMVRDRLFELSTCAGADENEADLALFTVLESNRDRVHSLFDFETELCRSVPACCPFVRTDPPNDCPPDWHHAGETCDYFGQVINIQ